MNIQKILLSASLAIASFSVTAENRLPTIPPATYNSEQTKAAEEFLAARKVPVFGPFEPLMYSPSLMSLARGMGDYLRYKPSIGTTLSELAILITAREWTQDYEWYVHFPAALKAGIKKELKGISFVFISSHTQEGILKLKDLIWKKLNTVDSEQ